MNYRVFSIYFLFCLLVFAASLIGICGQTIDWKKTYADDLEAARATIAADHPGMVDEQNPSFAAAMNAAYAKAVNAGKTVNDYNSYRVALMRFVNSFQDEHLSVGFQKPFENIREAGIYTTYRNGDFIVRSVDERYENARGNLAGAKLVGCDSLSANNYFERKVLSWRGRPKVQADWYKFASLMFVDYGLPDSPPPKKCRFLKDGKTVSLPLQWIETSGTQLGENLQKIYPPENSALDLERLGDGKVLWVNLPTFNVNTPEQISSMNKLIDSFKTELAENKSRDLIVFDLRDNSGGSSSWGNQFASALFGAEWMNAAQKWLGDGVYTEWRVSEDNLKALAGIVNQQKQRHGADSPAATYFQKFYDSMQNALANKTQFIATDKQEKSLVARPEKAPISEKVVVLTSPTCFSACLDFLDVMLANPAVVQVGQITGVDTVYMESWSKKLPSGSAQLGYPMKVYRNRRRGNNAAYAPRIAYSGELGDTEKVRAWILQNYRKW